MIGCSAPRYDSRCLQGNLWKDSYSCPSDALQTRTYACDLGASTRRQIYAWIRTWVCDKMCRWHNQASVPSILHIFCRLSREVSIRYMMQCFSAYIYYPGFFLLVSNHSRHVFVHDVSSRSRKSVILGVSLTDAGVTMNGSTMKLTNKKSR